MTKEQFLNKKVSQQIHLWRELFAALRDNIKGEDSQFWKDQIDEADEDMEQAAEELLAE
jgi:hypothetical protein